MFKKLYTQICKVVTAKKLVVGGAFVLALSGAVGAGLVVKQYSTASAAGSRDCSHNSIDNQNLNGGCGALSPTEWINDLRINSPGDLRASAAVFGNLGEGEYNKFAKEARYGTAYKNGNVYADGQLIMTDAWSIGRDYKAKSWRDHGYYANFSRDVFLSNSIPVLVYFNAQGWAQVVVLQPCGNLMGGKVVIPHYECNMMSMTPVTGKKNTYTFTTLATSSGNAILGSVIYEFGDGTSYTAPNGNVPVEHTYTKPGNYTAKATVFARLPGLQTVSFTAQQCQKQVTVTAPMYVCTGLVAKALDEELQNFRFTVKFKYANGPTPASADFTVDNSKTTNSTTKDAEGNYYFDAKFTDTSEHTISAKVNFTLDGHIVTTTESCVAKVTSKKKPMCTVPGKEMFPPNAAECHEECKPGIPVGDQRCLPPKELPKTGMGNVAGLFAGTSALGAVGHRLFSRRRR